MGLIRRLCVEEGAGSELADKLTENLGENLKEILSDNKVRVGTFLLIFLIDIKCLVLLMMTHRAHTLKFLCVMYDSTVKYL